VPDNETATETLTPGAGRWRAAGGVAEHLESGAGENNFWRKIVEKRSRTLFLTKTASFSFTNSISLGESSSFPPFPHCFPQGGEKAVFPTRSGGFLGKTRSFPHQNALFPVEKRVEKWKSGQKKSQATGLRQGKIKRVDDKGGGLTGNSTIQFPAHIIP